MKSVLRILGGIAGLLLIVALALAAYLSLVFDPNDYRGKLAELVRERTGRELVIAGDIGLSFFPWLSIELGEARLGNAAGFSERPFASVNRVQAGVKLLPLLGGQLEVNRLTLDGLRLSLEKAADGSTNWADLGAAGKNAPGEEHGGGSGPAGFELGGIQVRDAALQWEDRQSGERHSVEGLNLEAGAIVPGQGFALDASLGFKADQQKIAGTLRLLGEASIDTAASRYALKDLVLTLDASGEGVPGGQAKVTLGGDIEADLAAGTASARALKLAAYGLEAQADLAVVGLDGKALHIAGPLKLAPFDPGALMKALGIAAPADSAVLRQASLAAQLEAGPERLELGGLALRLDESSLSGRLAIEDFERQALRFDLALDRIDVDRYLPAAGGGAEKSAGGPAGEKGPALPALDVEGRFTIGELKVSGLSVNDIRLAVSGQGGRYRLQPEATLYQGRYRGNISLDGRSEVLKVSADDQLSGVAIGPLLRALTGKEEKLTGRADVDLKLTAAGADAAAYKRSLDGAVKLRVADGAVKGVNVAAYLRQAQARLSGKPLAAAAEAQQTDFSDLTATIGIARGVARNDDLSLRSPLLRVGGSGNANLNTEAIDYLVKASVVGTLTGQDGKSLESLRGVTVPIRVNGSFAEPKFTLDVDSLVKGAVKEKIEEKKAEIKKKAGDALKKELEKGLGGLFR